MEYLVRRAAGQVVGSVQNIHALVVLTLFPGRTPNLHFLIFVITLKFKLRVFAEISGCCEVVNVF